MKWVEIWAKIQVIGMIAGAVLTILAMLFCAIMMWVDKK